MAIIRIILISTILFIGSDNFNYLKLDKADNQQQKIVPTQINEIKLKKMTLREKIGQMVISSVVPDGMSDKVSIDKKLERLCSETKVGGFIFFKGSVKDYSRLSNKLQSYSETPLLISADFERGTGMRVTDGSLFPNNMALGASGNTELAYQMGLMIAKESRAIGVHQNYAPVCDVNNNPNNPIINVRSFGEDPQLVSRMSASVIKGLQDSKVIATSKHFPGHGDTDIDSHNDLPVLSFDMERMNSVELVPFRNAIDNKVMSVMIAHISFPVLESTPNVPASLSKKIVDGLLIKQLGFNGLIVTDALNMKGITKYFSTEEVAVMCVEAGIDLILMPLDDGKSISAIEKAVVSGRISEERINISVEKILKAKEWLGLFENKFIDETDVYNKVNTDEAKQLAQKIADESITLVKDDYNILPLNDFSKSVGLITLSDGKENYNFDMLKNSFQKKLSNLLMTSFTDEISRGNLNAVLEQSKDFDYILIAIYAKVRFGTGKISILQSHIHLIEELSKSNKNIIVVAYGNPYLLKEFPEIPSYICSYGDSPISIEASIKAITGEIKFKGHLPVSINENYKFGTGITK